LGVSLLVALELDFGLVVLTRYQAFLLGA
jgi:hypothetical protein